MSIKLPARAIILPPSDNRIFKVLLTHPDAGPILRSIISAAIGRVVVSVQILNTELPISDVKEKAQRLDVNCIIDGGDQINVEMQCSRLQEAAGESRSHKGFINKYIYYLTDLHSRQKSKGVEYHKLARTYQITFCEYNIFPKHPDFVHRVSMRRDTGEQVSDQINMIIVEMKKLSGILNKPVETLTLLEMWTAFLMFASKPKYRNLINNINEMKEEIAMASALLMEISKDDHERALFLSRKKAETDRVSDLLTVEERGWTKGRAKGRAEGRAEGEAKGMAKVALNMKRNGMPVEIISQLTTLSAREIEKL